MRKAQQLVGDFRLPSEKIQGLVAEVSLPSEKMQQLVREQLKELAFPRARLIEAAREAIVRSRQLLETSLPPNWSGMSARDVDRVLAFSDQTGVNTVWVPRLEIINELTAADSADAVERVLTARARDILADIDACIDGVTHRSMTEGLRLTREAVAAARDGHYVAAQALAGSVLTSLVHTTLGFERFKDARARFMRDDPDHVGLSVFRLTVTLRTLGRALTPTWEADPGFNRHASLHAHSGHYTPIHSLSALMLLAGVLREVDHQLNRQDREREDAA